MHNKKRRKMKVLVACEFSGIVRDAFIAKGYNAISCDLSPTEKSGPHIQADHDLHLLDIIKEGWDLMIAHPPCTRLCVSGVMWLEKRDLWEEMRIAARFFKALLDAPISKIAVENPIPHGYAVKEIGRKYNQIIQSWQFGHGETKATCLWLKNLPELRPTNIVKGREHKIWKMPPSKDRGKLRSVTYTGIAKAMATQWGF